jgi:hypothetical protein
LVAVLVNPPHFEPGEGDSKVTAAQIEARDSDLRAITPEMTLEDVRKRLGIEPAPYNFEVTNNMYQFHKPAYGRYFIIVTLDMATGRVASSQYWTY